MPTTCERVVRPFLTGCFSSNIFYPSLIHTFVLSFSVSDKPNEQMDSNGRWKTAFWALLVIVLLVLVVIVVAVVIKKIWRRHDQAILPVKGNGVANGNAVDDANSSAVTVANGDAVVNNGNNVELDVEDGKRDENNFKNDGLDDGYVGDNIVQNGNWVWTTSC